ncbi:uncharacterized protein FIBRA_04369 [Fibroporia radiculosa]|uniref:Myb-like domain-containing protein n=1 Tax=Fibroporia radiculosa TaxID=599839 RepID=J4HWH7_9APHY|nr:uncharacterized protein FIBRA_04369 [Fibroporia radiculosa]CCM02282.1 predicted protein [Fibroporia radiculosa]
MTGPSASLPSTSTFSFTAPFPPESSAAPSPLKQRRVSLASAASPRLVPAWSFRDDTGLGVHSGDQSSPSEKRGKMRRVDSGGDRPDDEYAQPYSEKKARKKWTMEETQMLVNGCNKWGVGNWKSILNDPEFKFDNRSPVDLKDRFRTYFPDAYKQHYPNAKTHLSSKIRSALPDGTSIFEKTRSKKRRPFTEEEDRALKAGYDKHGTVWATIVKDPIFQEQNRRSTDLRDRFRNAFPELYQAAGYKPRAPAKKKKGDMSQPLRAATDDQLASTSATGPVRRKRRNTTQGLFRGGTKSVPESAACSEDEDSSEGEDEVTRSMIRDGLQSAPPEQMTPASEMFATEVDMQPADTVGDGLSFPELLSNSSLSEITDCSSQSQPWSMLDTPLHSSAWSTTNAASPTSSHISSDYLLNNSPFNRRAEGAGMMIGKSAWGPQDWLSANPRLDPSGACSSNSSFIGGVSPVPSSPFSFAHLNHGVLDRYDLFPPSLAHDFASEVGVGDSHSTFSDPDMFTTSSFRGFTHHSNYAGDLIFGARSHQPHQPFDYGPGFGFGSAGLGLSGMQQSSAATGLHPMQMHTPALPGIDEIELTSITLDDHVDMHDAMEAVETVVSKDDRSVAAGLVDLSTFNLPTRTLEEIVGITPELNATPPGTPQTSSRSLRHSHIHLTSSHNRSVSVPPSEHRAALPRAAQTQVLKPRPLLHGSPRSHSMDIYSPEQDILAQGQSLQPDMAYSADNWRSQGDMYGVPYLDLHYYTSSATNNAPPPMPLEPDLDSAYAKSSLDLVRQGQALDLAETLASASRAMALPPSLMQHMPMVSHSANSTPPATTRMLPMHHRGQSAVSPQDLLLRKGSDNKRKRSSWDGGMH